MCWNFGRGLVGLVVMFNYDSLCCQCRCFFNWWNQLHCLLFFLYYTLECRTYFNLKGLAHLVSPLWMVWVQNWDDGNKTTFQPCRVTILLLIHTAFASFYNLMLKTGMISTTETRKIACWNLKIKMLDGLYCLL